MKCIKHKWQYNPALVAINYSFFLEYQDSNNLKTYPLPAGLCSFPAILAQILGLKLVIRKTVNFSTEYKINLPTHVFVLTVYDMQGLENTTSGVGITSQCHTPKLRWGSVILSEDFSCMNVPMSRSLEPFETPQSINGMIHCRQTCQRIGGRYVSFLGISWSTGRIPYPRYLPAGTESILSAVKSMTSVMGHSWPKMLPNFSEWADTFLGTLAIYDLHKL